MLNFKDINTYPISERINKFTLDDMIPLQNSHRINGTLLDQLAQQILERKKRGGKVMVMLGGAVIKTGCGRLLIDLVERGLIDHVAGNGAVSIHDFEIALIGETSEDVVNGLSDGTFGMVEETGAMMNEAINTGAAAGLGYGEAIARYIDTHALPYRHESLLYRAWKKGIPVTIHVAVGGDIIHQHPSADGAALGGTSFTDFKYMTETVSTLAGGALLNIGSAVNMPEAFLKSLTIARNLKQDVRDFAIANFDFMDMYRPRTRLLEWPQALDCPTYDVRAGHDVSIPTLHRFLTA